MNLLKLIENEVIKMLSKRKLLLITAILCVLVSLFAYGEMHAYRNTVQRFMKSSGQTQNYNWKSLANQQIADLKNNRNRPNVNENRKNSMNIQIEQLKYYLDHNINPITPSAGKFTVEFMQQAVYLFLPLLMIILSGDIVSGEFSSKTIKMLLTRAVPRWKILLSKYIAVLILSCIVILETAAMCILISTFMFHNSAWTEPIITGFKVVKGNIDTSGVVKLYQWQYAILVYSLGWFSAICIATLSFMISVLVKNTATSIGIIMASLIGGQFLQFYLSDWPLVKYFFAVNLNLPQYLTGSYQPIEGMSLIFSTLVLCAWSFISLIISFKVFSKEDILV
jgi:ABC-2 type transport system permease protein